MARVPIFMAAPKWWTAILLLAGAAGAHQHRHKYGRTAIRGGARPRGSLHALARGGAGAAAARDVDRQIVAIALPALAGLCIDPLATLVDTAWAAQLGTTELAALGASASIFGLCAKSFNFLLSATTSAVAAAAAAAPADGAAARSDPRRPPLSGGVAEIAASALALALCIGAPLGLAICACAPAILGAASIGPGSAVFAPALSYLRLRAPATPFVLGTMALTGVFRGLRDTRTPLLALSVSSALNVALDPLLLALLPRRRQVAGLAAATTLSQAVGLLVLLAALLARAPAGALRPSWPRMLGLGRSASVLTARTFCGLLVYARASAAAAACSPLAGAAHAVAFQLWMSSALLADALAIACQALLASSLAAAGGGAQPSPRLVVVRTTRLSALLALALAAGLGLGRGALLALLTPDAAVRSAAAAVWPLVVGSQPVTVGAFAIDGVLFGAREFGGAAASMIGAAAPALLLLRGVSRAPPAGQGLDGLSAVWRALVVFMAVRTAIGAGFAARSRSLGGGRRRTPGGVGRGGG